MDETNRVAAVLLSLTIYPLFYSIKISLQSESGNWTLQNFARLVNDQFFLSALAHTFVYAAIALTLRHRKDSKYIDPAKQINIHRKDRVRMVSMRSESKDEG